MGFLGFSIHVPYILYFAVFISAKGRRGPDHMVIGFTTTCVTSAYHH
jgi:hypothetical protein